MLGQTFDLFDIARLSALAFIEIVLSADNTIVLAVLSRALPEAKRHRALLIGLISAFFLRAGALLLVSLILHLTWVEILGAAYLIYLSLRHLTKKKPLQIAHTPTSFWKTVFLIETFDLIFALDSIIAGIAFVATPTPTTLNPKLWIVYAGGMIGLIFIRYAAHLCSRLIDRFPHFETSAYLLVGLIGLKLLLEATLSLPYLEYLFWALFALIFSFSFLKRKKFG